MTDSLRLQMTRELEHLTTEQVAFAVEMVRGMRGMGRLNLGRLLALVNVAYKQRGGG